MSIQPGLPTSGGSLRGINERLGAHNRRINTLERGGGSTVIAEDAITGLHIAPGSINTGEIAAGSITSASIAAGTITADDIAAGSITAITIAVGAITASKIEAGAITAEKISAGAISAVHIAAGSITASEIQAGTINASLIAANAITAQHIQSATISAGHIVSASISAGHIQADAINAAHIQAGAVTATEIAAGAVTAVTLAAGAVTAGSIAADAVTAAAIQAGAVTATKIAALAITTDKLAAGAVTTAKMTVTGGLSSITADLGNINAGTITGGTFQSSSSGSRVVMNSLGLFGYAVDGVTKVFEINAGSGIAKFTGTATLDSTSVVPSASLSGSISGALLPAMGGMNYVKNSRGDTGIADWLPSGSTLAIETTIKRSGAQSFRVTSTASGSASIYRENTHAQALTVTAGQKLVMSAWVYGGAGGVGRTAAIQARWLAGTTNTYSTSPTVTLTAGWQRLVFAVTVPAGVTKMGYLVYISATASGQIFYATEIQVEDGEVVTAWVPHIDELGGTVAPGSITSEKLADGAVIAAKVAAGSIVAGKIAANAVTATEILAGTITAVKIATGTITANEIAAGAITATTIAAGAVTASKLSVEFGGSNMVWNSSFEDTTGIGPWLGSGGTASVVSNEVVPLDGKSAAKIIKTSALGAVTLLSSSASAVTGYRGSYGAAGTYPGYYPLVSGKPYTLSAWAASVAASRQFATRFYWYDSLLRTTLPAPTAAATAIVATGGTLAAGTYYYRITAVNANGETLGTTEISRAVVAGEAVNVSALMPANAPDTPYPVTKVRVYRSSTPGTYSGYLEANATGGTTVTLGDTGQALTGTTAPPASGTAVTVAASSTAGTYYNSAVSNDPNAVLTASQVRVTNSSLVTGGDPTSTVWTRAQMTLVPPVGAVFTRPAVTFLAVPVDEAHYVDGVVMEPGEVVSRFAPRVGEVLPGTVGATQITPNSITAQNILAGTITTAEIAAGAVKALNIEAGAIEAGKIQAGALNAFTITSPVIFSGTDASNRVEFTSTGIRMLVGGIVKVNLPTSGDPTFTGTVNASGGAFSGTVTGGIFQGGTFRSAASGSRVEFNATELKVTTGEATMVKLAGGSGVDLTWQSTYGVDRAIRWMDGATKKGEVVGYNSPYNTGPGMLMKARNAANTGDSVIATDEGGAWISRGTNTTGWSFNNDGTMYMPQVSGARLYFYSQPNTLLEFGGSDSIVKAWKPTGTQNAWFPGWSDGFQYHDSHNGYRFRSGDGGTTHFQVENGFIINSRQTIFGSGVELCMAGGGTSGGIYEIRMRESYGFNVHANNGASQVAGYGAGDCIGICWNNTGHGGSSGTVGDDWALAHPSYSSGQMKENISDWLGDGALARARALRPVKFDFNDMPDSIQGVGLDMVGFIAEEVEEVYPEAVATMFETWAIDSTDPQSVRALKGLEPLSLIASLTAAVQELTEIVLKLSGKQPTDHIDRHTPLPNVAALSERVGRVEARVPNVPPR